MPILLRKIQHLLLYIRERFGLRTTDLDEEFKEALIQKTGLPPLDINLLFVKLPTPNETGSFLNMHF